MMNRTTLGVAIACALTGCANLAPDFFPACRADPDGMASLCYGRRRPGEIAG